MAPGVAGAAPLLARARAAVARLNARQKWATASELAELDRLAAAIDAAVEERMRQAGEPDLAACESGIGG
jgi:hypothetical protein